MNVVNLKKNKKYKTYLYINKILFNNNNNNNSINNNNKKFLFYLNINIDFYIKKLFKK